MVDPCPTCPEGWRPLGKEHCADCYEGKIERLREAAKLVVATFEKDEAQGFRSRDRQFAISILRAALSRS
jgi:hypothetical protein